MPQPGERVVDLGSGAGMDSLLADTFAEASGEEKARNFGTYGYAIRAAKPL